LVFALIILESLVGIERAWAANWPLCGKEHHLANAVATIAKDNVAVHVPPLTRDVHSKPVSVMKRPGSLNSSAASITSSQIVA
jgi:hypothetical protein